MEKIANVIVWAIVIQGLFLGLTYIFSKKSKSKANKVLGFFLLAFVLEALTSDFFPVDQIGSYYIGDYFRLPEVKLLFPVLFLHYIVEKLHRTQRYNRLLRIHYFLVAFIFLLTVINVKLHFLGRDSLRNVLGNATIEIVFMTFQYYAFLLTILALIAAVIETKRYTRIVQNEFTDFAMLQINWLWQLIFILVPIIALWGAELVYIIFGGEGPSDFASFTWIFVFIFLYFFSFKAYRNPNLFQHVPVSIQKEIGVGTVKKEKHLCSSENSERIIFAMGHHQLYLNEELTIHSFAKEIDMSPRLISTCINKSLGYNFNEWVNNYRVEKALQIIESDKNNMLSIEGIGSDSGFKSRSAMYASFKKKLGHSPGFYRKKESPKS